MGMLTATTEDILVDTDMAAMVITLERDLLKPSHTTAQVMVDTVTVDTVDMFTENRFHMSLIFSGHLILFHFMMLLFTVSNVNEKVIKSKFVETCIFGRNE